MSIFWQSYGFYLWLVTTVLMVGFAGVLAVLWKRLSTTVANYAVLTRGVDGNSLDAILQERSIQIQQHQELLAEIGERLSLLEREGLRRVGLVRYNPFGDVGGDQSFALALLDGEKNGLVISTIFTRSNMRIYAKSIQAGRSTHHLSDEEIAAIERALGAETITVQDEA